MGRRRFAEASLVRCGGSAPPSGFAISPRRRREAGVVSWLLIFGEVELDVWGEMAKYGARIEL